jgi:CBS domain-containing protein
MLDVNVADVALRLPKTLRAETTVADAYEAFADDHVHMLLLTTSGRLLGTLLRADLDAADDGDDLALAYAVLAGRTLAPTCDAEDARRLLVARGERRRAVVDRDGRLLGLLCLKRLEAGFCSEADIAGRAAEHLVTASGGSLR